MKSSATTKFLAVAAVAAAAFGVTTAAHARSDVILSIGLQGAPMYYEPAPVYVQPQPVYVQPQTYYYGNDWRYRHHYRQTRLYGPNGDLDRDGIRNQYDRDRDGDGVSNRRDRNPDNAYRY